jgi:hypothetical protein
VEGAKYVEAEWPPAEFIVGNPPFLGGKLMRKGLGDEYIETLFDIYDGRVPPEADLVTYWFEKAHAQIKIGCTQRAGFVATNSIRGGASRRVLDRIVEESRIFGGAMSAGLSMGRRCECHSCASKRTAFLAALMGKWSPESMPI